MNLFNPFVKYLFTEKGSCSLTDIFSIDCKSLLCKESIVY